MRKKLLAILLCVAMVASMVTACGGSSDSGAPAADGADEAEVSDFKFGAVLVGDENEGYTYAHIEGIRKAMEELGLTEDNVIWKYSTREDESCYDAIVDCINSGCTLIFTNSYGHQSFAEQAASEYPDVQIVAMTGDTAKASGLDNFHNAFTAIYEARYVAGIVAGMKLQELDEAGEIGANNRDADGNVKIGYVGAFPYAEVVSGYTAFFLGIRSVYPNAVMEVQYTNEWFHITKENEAALALINDGCIIIGQHADSTGAPSACEEKLTGGTTVYSVSYNIDMLSVAPTAALTSPQNNWDVYYTYAIGACLNGEAFDTNWCKGYDAGAVQLSPLGDSCAEGTQEAVDAAIASIMDGSFHVFDTSTFTVGGEEPTTAFATDTDGDFVQDTDEAIFDGYYHESHYQSAPAFTLRIDGITELN